MRLSVVVPAYNEERRIEDLVRTIERDLRPLGDDYELIVVDDGSSDRTAQLVSGMDTVLISHEVNKGKAAAVQAGLAVTRGDYVAVLDADLEYAPSDLLKLLHRVEPQSTDTGEVAAVYGSRYLESANFRGGLAGRLRILTGQELTSWAANWVLTALVLLLFGKLITDTLTGSKLYPGEFLRAQRLQSIGFEGDHEITARLIRAHIPIREVGIAYAPRSRSEGKKIGPRDGVIAIITFVKFRFR